MANQKREWGKPKTHSTRNPNKNGKGSQRQQHRQFHRNSFGLYQNYNRCECCDIPVDGDDVFSDIRDVWRNAGERGRYGDLGLVLCEKCSLMLSDMNDDEAFFALTKRSLSSAKHRVRLTMLAENVQKWGLPEIEAEINKVKANPEEYASPSDIYDSNYLSILKRELAIRKAAFGNLKDPLSDNSL